MGERPQTFCSNYSSRLDNKVVGQTLTGREFELAVRRLADSLSPGQDLSGFLGQGVDYAQSRLFADGDPVRAIDWRVTARTGKTYVKEYEALQRLPVQLLVDTSSSMRTASVSPGKYELAVLLAGGLALAALKRASPVGVLSCGEMPLRMPLSSSRGQVFVWLHQLRREKALKGERTTLARRVVELRSLLTSRCLVLVISDLHDPDAMTAIKRLAVVHDCVVIQPQDPAEFSLRGAGIMRLAEAETGADFTSGGGGGWHANNPPSRALAQAGIDHLVLPIDRPFIPVMRRFLAERDRRSHAR